MTECCWNATRPNKVQAERAPLLSRLPEKNSPGGNRAGAEHGPAAIAGQRARPTITRRQLTSRANFIIGWLAEGSNLAPTLDPNTAIYDSTHCHDGGGPMRDKPGNSGLLSRIVTGSHHGARSSRSVGVSIPPPLVGEQLTALFSATLFSRRAA